MPFKRLYCIRLMLNQDQKMSKKLEALSAIREAILLHSGFTDEQGDGNYDRLTKDELRNSLEDTWSYLPTLMEHLKEIQKAVEDI